MKFADLSLSSTEVGAISTAISTCNFIGGEAVRQFEYAFSEYLGVDHCIGVGNGTDAIEIAIEALGIHNKSIIVPALTAVPTVEAIVRSGNRPLFCDVDQSTMTVDISTVCVTNDTAAIIPVHLYGHPCDMTTIMDFADLHSLLVIEDCSHAHGATYNGVRLGSIGDIGTFSFYPSKPLGAIGDGGAIVTDNPIIAARCRRIANHGRLSRDDFNIVGRNSRLDAIQAAVLNAKLPSLDGWNTTRRSIANLYRQSLPGVITQSDNPGHAYHQFVVLVPGRSRVRSSMGDIETIIHYPYIIPELPPYNCKGYWPIATSISRHVLSLPLHLTFTRNDVMMVANSLG